ncbi:MAG: AfsR/SARP family transcriptional regulator [Chloroflexia bacterium]
MGVLEVQTLGKRCVSYDGVPLEFPTSKARDLLILLLLRAGEYQDRDALAEQLWPTSPAPKARHALSTTFWRLRRALPIADSGGECFLQAGRRGIRFNARAAYRFDVEAFVRCATLGLEGTIPLDDERYRALCEALTLYRGDFMDGCYDDWCLLEHERLQLLLIRVLKRLLRDARRNQAFDQAVEYGQRLLALDPLQEDVHRELMRCYAEAGQRSQALLQFQRCRETLRQELGVEPMPETWALYRRVRGGERSSGPFSERASVAALDIALGCVSRALEALQAAWQALQDARVGL